MNGFHHQFQKTSTKNLWNQVGLETPKSNKRSLLSTILTRGLTISKSCRISRILVKKVRHDVVKCWYFGLFFHRTCSLDLGTSVLALSSMSGVFNYYQSSFKTVFHLAVAEIFEIIKETYQTFNEIKWKKIRLVLTTARCCREINPDQVKITPRQKHQSPPPPENFATDSVQKSKETFLNI